MDEEMYSLNFGRLVPEKDDPVVRDVAPPSEDRFITRGDQAEDGYSIDLDKLPDEVVLEAPSHWHPNKDANGNYMSPLQFRNAGWGYPYGNGYVYGTNPYVDYLSQQTFGPNPYYTNPYSYNPQYYSNLPF